MHTILPNNITQFRCIKKAGPVILVASIDFDSKVQIPNTNDEGFHTSHFHPWNNHGQPKANGRIGKLYGNYIKK